MKKKSWKKKKDSVQYVCTKTPRSDEHIIWVTKTPGVEAHYMGYPKLFGKIHCHWNQMKEKINRRHRFLDPNDFSRFFSHFKGPENT